MITLAVGIFLLYCLIIALVYKVHESISNTAYTIGHHVFAVVMLAVMFLLFSVLNENIFFIIGSFLLGAVGVASDYKWSRMNKIHVGAALGSIACFVIGIFVEKLLMGSLSLNFILIAVIATEKIKNKTWWREIAIILIIYVFLMLL